MNIPITLPSNWQIDKAELAKAIEVFNTRPRPILGVVGEYSPSIDLQKVSHEVINLNLAEDGSVSANVIPLKTLHGEMLNALIESAASMKYSLVGTYNLHYPSGSEVPFVKDLKIVSVSAGPADS